MPAIVGDEVIAQPPEYPPSVESLRAKALAYIKECKPRDYRRMKRNGELEKYLDLAVEACQDYARRLIEQGMWEREAWNMAIRQEILESESD